MSIFWPNFLFSKKNQFIFLALIWLGMQLFFIYQNGIITNLEAAKYINEAHHFLNVGGYSTGNYLFYSTQILLIAFCLKFGIGFWLVVLLQILLNGISVWCFYNIVSRVASRPWLPMVGTLYFLLFFYYQVFNTFLFTESLFFSLSVIYTYALFSTTRLSAKAIGGILILLGLLYFTRPTGIFFIPATFIFITIKFFRKVATRIIILSFLSLMIAFLFLLNYSIGSGGELDFLLPYIHENIICGVPSVALPNHFSIPLEKNSIQGLFYFITHYPGLFAVLALKRMMAFFGLFRSYFSLWHNIILSAFFYLLYAVVLWNLKWLFKKYLAESSFLFTNILLLTITVMLSCDEWGNRFMLSLFPLFLILAVFAINHRIGINSIEGKKV